MHIEWPLFGELSRALALKVARAYDPELVVGIATAGVVPAAVVSAILDREFHSIMVSRRLRAERVRETPAVPGIGARRRAWPARPHCRRDLRLGRHHAAGGRRDRQRGRGAGRTAVCFKTGTFEPDFYALATESTIVLPWDREVLVEGELVPNPMYEGVDRGERGGLGI